MDVVDVDCSDCGLIEYSEDQNNMHMHQSKQCLCFVLQRDFPIGSNVVEEMSPGKPPIDHV